MRHALPWSGPCARPLRHTTPQLVFWSNVVVAGHATIPSVPGVMGRHYALAEGRAEDVAAAVYEGVLPRFAGDELAVSKPGFLLAVADRWAWHGVGRVF